MHWMECCGGWLEGLCIRRVLVCGVFEELAHLIQGCRSQARVVAADQTGTRSITHHVFKTREMHAQ